MYENIDWDYEYGIETLTTTEEIEAAEELYMITINELELETYENEGWI